MRDYRIAQTGQGWEVVRTVVQANSPNYPLFSGTFADCWAWLQYHGCCGNTSQDERELTQ